MYIYLCLFVQYLCWLYVWLTVVSRSNVILLRRQWEETIISYAYSRLPTIINPRKVHLDRVRRKWVKSDARNTELSKMRRRRRRRRRRREEGESKGWHCQVFFSFSLLLSIIIYCIINLVFLLSLLIFIPFYLIAVSRAIYLQGVEEFF